MNRKKVNIISSLLILVLAFIDQLIKYFVVKNLKGKAPFTLIPNILQFRYLENDGAMMGFLKGKIAVVTVFAVICLLGIALVIFSGKLNNIFQYSCVVLIASGGIGNLIDRIFRGFVVDYIEVLFVDFYVFNFADCLVTVSAFMIIVHQIYLIVKDSGKKKENLLND